MIDLKDTTVITTLTVDTPDRLRNAELFLRYYEQFCRNQEIIVVEQDTESRIGSVLSKHPSVFHHFVETSNCHSRARNLNSGAKLSERQYLIICDVDIFIPPKALDDAMKMVRQGTDFLLPYNGVVIQVKRNAISHDMDLDQLMSRLVYFSRMHEIRPPKYDPDVFEHMYGSVLSDTVGGIMICNRRQFFLAGAMNENMISFGCEEGEFYHRVRKLGYKMERLDHNNGYHYEHIRSINSMKNNYYHANREELERVRQMSKRELRRYINDGYKMLNLDTKYDVTTVNTSSCFMIQLESSPRIDLSSVCTVLLFETESAADPETVEHFLDKMEKQFDCYSLYLVETGKPRLKFALARKYTQHVSLNSTNQALSEDDISKHIHTDRPQIDYFRFTTDCDADSVIQKYIALSTSRVM